MTAEANAAVLTPAERPGRYDPCLRRRAKRAGRERGCWIYIPAAELEKAGRADTWPLFYRVWGSKRGGLTLRLYADA